MILLFRGFYKNIKSPAYIAIHTTYARDVKYAVPPLLSEYNSNHFILLNAERRTVLKSLRGGIPSAHSELLSAYAVLSVRIKQRYYPHQRFQYINQYTTFKKNCKAFYYINVTLTGKYNKTDRVLLTCMFQGLD